MHGQAAAILKRPPHGASSGDAFEVYTTAFTGSSSASTAVLPSNGGLPSGGCFVTWIADADCYVRVGKGTVAAATSGDWFLPAGVQVDWWHNDTEDLNFTVIQKTSAGNLKRYRSNL